MAKEFKEASKKKKMMIAKTFAKIMTEALAKTLITIVEVEIGQIPLEAMKDELQELLYEWIDEVDSENHLKWKLENDRVI